MTPTAHLLSLSVATVFLASCAPALRGAPETQHTLAHAQTTGELELVTTFTDDMPTGVTVSQEGRIFVNFPRWGDPVAATVAEIVDGKPVPYPDADTTKLDLGNAAGTFVSVQSVVVDPADRLWVLDTGSINFAPVVDGGPKFVGIDLETNRVFKTITFPENVVLPTT